LTNGGRRRVYSCFVPLFYTGTYLFFLERGKLRIQAHIGPVWLVPNLALPNLGQELAANFFIKKSLAPIWPTIWQESMSRKGGHPLAAKILATNQTMTKA
jgi:hypothetical protein